MGWANRVLLPNNFDTHVTYGEEFQFVQKSQHLLYMRAFQSHANAADSEHIKWSYLLRKPVIMLKISPFEGRTIAQFLHMCVFSSSWQTRK